MPEDFLDLGHYNFVKIIVKHHLQLFWQNFENGKMQKFGFCLQDFEKIFSPKLLNKILRYCIQIVLQIVYI